jgi:hypothetical protein
MNEFLAELWTLFRAENENGRRLRWGWVALLFSPIAVLYCVAAPVCALADWLGRRYHWLRWLRFFGIPPANIFFTKNRLAEKPSQDAILAR